MKRTYNKPELEMLSLNSEKTYAADAVSTTLGQNIYSPNDVNVEWEDLFK